jgi:hypothetical protein
LTETTHDAEAYRHLTETLDKHRNNREAWTRAAHLFRFRRIQLGRGYANRRRFAAERDINYKLVSDVEHAGTSGRMNFTPEVVIDDLAPAYQITPWSVAGALEGGALVPLPGTPALSPAAPPPPVGPDLELPAQAHLREIAARLEMLREAGITRPSGRQVFPAGGPDAADWDAFTAEGWEPAEAAAMVAAVRVRAETARRAGQQEQGAV